jgi:hypothetical protein
LDGSKRALSTFLAEVEMRLSGWWFYIDRDVFEKQDPPTWCPEATPKLSSLMGAHPLVTSWMLSNAGLAYMPKQRGKPAKYPQMKVDVDAWRQFGEEFDLSLETATLKLDNHDCFFLRIGNIPQLPPSVLAVATKVKNHHRILQRR